MSDTKFLGKFTKKTSKAGKPYMTASFTEEDIDFMKSKCEKGYFNGFAGISQKTGCPYISYSERGSTTTNQTTTPF